MDRKVFLALFITLFTLLIFSQAFAVKDGLVVYFPFNGSVKDLSANGFKAEIIGKESYTEGKFEKAFQFDGATHIEIPDSKNGNFDNVPGLTIEVWVKQDTHHDNGIVVKLTTAGTYWPCSYNLETWSDQLIYFDVGADAGTYATGKYPLGKWYHVAGVFDGNKKEDRLYVDGQLASANPRKETVVPDGNLPVYVGCVTPGQLYFKGALDDLAIYNRVLTEAEIQRDMSAFVMPVESKGKLTSTWAEIKK